MPRPATPLLWLLSLLLCFAAAAQSADDTPLGDADRDAIRDVIRAQLAAFRAGDGATAFSYASPGIQRHFGSPERFMSMVRNGYRPVYENRRAYFQEAISADGVVAQKVLIVDRDSRSVTAIYPMQKQDDGSWRIDGCYLDEARGLTL